MLSCTRLALFSDRHVTRDSTHLTKVRPPLRQARPVQCTHLRTESRPDHDGEPDDTHNGVGEARVHVQVLVADVHVAVGVDEASVDYAQALLDVLDVARLWDRARNEIVIQAAGPAAGCSVRCGFRNRGRSK